MNIDKGIIFFLPIVLIIFLSFSDEKLVFYGSILSLAIIVYELIIYHKRDMYGLSGLKIITLPSLVLLTFTIFIALPSIYICNIKNGSAVNPYFFSIILFYILYPLGLLLGDVLKRINIPRLKEMKESGLVKTNVDSIIYELLIMLLLISLCIFIVYFFRVKTIPLFEMIKNPGMYFKLNIMREKALKLLEVTIFEDYLFRWQRSFILPVGVIASLFLAVKYKLRKYMILFLIFLIAGIFINSLTLEKSPTAGIFLALMVFVYFRKNKINLKFLIGATILVFSGPLIIMYFLQFGRENILTVIALSFLYRIFIVPSEALYYYFEIFPKTHDFLYGRSTKLFSWLHDEGTFPISNYVAKIWWKNPYTSGLANVNFIGNYWADFGWIGVILSCFVVGIIIHLFYWKLITISNYSKNIIYVTSICIISPIFTFGFFSVNFTILFFTTGLILLVVFLLMFNYIMKKIFNLKFGNIIKNSS